MATEFVFMQPAQRPREPGKQTHKPNSTKQRPNTASMAKDFEEFDDDDQEDDDDDIGALGSILSWDEDEDGGVAGPSSTALSDTNSTALPDLVSFNLKDASLSTLQQLQSIGEAQALNLPLPTPINFSQQGSRATEYQNTMPQHKKENQKGGTRTPPPTVASVSNVNGTSTQAQQQQQIQQQFEQHRQQQQQQQIQQYQIQQQTTSQLIPQQTTTQQTQQTQAAQAVQSNGAANTSQAAVAHPAAFQLFQQGALLTQQNAGKQPLIPAIMVPSVPQPGQDPQNPAQQFAFAADPSSFLRQLQVAQLQQQFNAVQQGRPLAQQVVAPGNQVPRAMQQQMQYQGQVNAVAAPPQQHQAQANKRPRPPAQKKPAPSTRPQRTSTSVAVKSAVVSASDTDGELSSRVISTSSKSQKKTGSSSLSQASSRKKVEIDTSNMTPEEKARANRDRNREHARNTRLRKKAYLEKLKSTVDELCRERDTLVSERAGAANILVEMHNTRTEVLMSFFALRSANEKRRELWSSILDESCFACVMPVTPYRSFPASEVQVSKCQRTILGIDGMMSDTASLHVLLNSLVDRSRYPSATIVFRYTLVTEEAVVARNQMMARWVMSTLNATQCGARMEVSKQGMLCCKFNSAHKIIGLELMFDVMALMLQLKQAAGSDTFSVIPNTVQTCQRSFDKPMVMTLAEEPYTIVQVNKLWEEMTGYKAEEVVGKTSCRILEGEETEKAAVEGLMREVRFKRPASAMILHYKKSGERFRNFFLVYPLSTDSRITHYLCLSNHTDTGQSVRPTEIVQQGKEGVLQGSTATSQVTPHIQQGPPVFLSNVPVVSNGLPPSVPTGSQQVYGLPTVISNTASAVHAQGSMVTAPIDTSGQTKPSTTGVKRSPSSIDTSEPPVKKSKDESDTVVAKAQNT